ncbi:DUF427 domain-containing protein [Nostocoides sp. HKS02]|uniref:DUF427 domain-containing protein n=1 Tax=Nostocoides sp. HKS02 TaxID=1813880 RepID=UPI0012B4AA41|nr:DUF427 domain-containing protein [Tetrasphaera sp. HKS02]QGN57085.1 DUF427 domain-containing protein [Tetrasphaera sp. HKS02]
MSLDLSAQWRSSLAELRYASTAKRLRATLDGEPALDTTDALLVWEPRRVVPQYAVPAQDLRVRLEALPATPTPADLPPVMGPQNFAVHTCPGTALTPTSGASAGVEVGFRPDDPALGGRIILDFARFDWTEEDEPVMGHAHDPFKRIDVLRSNRHVVVRLGDTVLAESRRAHALFETSLPVRWYLPREDVRMDLLAPSQTHTVCAYKGVASYLSADLEGGTDIAWFYPDPLHDALPVRDLVAFWSERAEVTVDGAPVAGRMPPEAPGRRAS